MSWLPMDHRASDPRRINRQSCGALHGASHQGPMISAIDPASPVPAKDVS